MILRRLRRMYLLLLLILYNIKKNESVAIIMGVRNIYDFERMANSFASIRNQDYGQNLIHIILVDYASDMCLSSPYKEMCEKYDAEYIRIENKPIWSRAHALNIGIKKAKTKYILCSDIDIIFERNYIKEAIRELKRDPLQVIISTLLDLPDIPTSREDYSQLKLLATVRLRDSERCSGISFGPGINLAMTYFYHKMRGYDEEYKLWGGEDTDLIKRFKSFGLRIKSIENRTSYLHQYHAQYRNIKEMAGYEEQIEKNRAYFRSNASIVRNKIDWGTLV